MEGEDGHGVEGRKRRSAAILAREIKLGFARASRLLFASAICRILRIERRRSRVCVHICTYVPDAKFDPGPPNKLFSRELDASYLPGTGRETNYSKVA